MPDMLVKLYDLPPAEPEYTAMNQQNIKLRRGLTSEKHLVTAWVKEQFSDYWASEVDVAFAQRPPTIYLAIRDDQLLGFACYDTTHKGFFGPTGVHKSERGKGIGRALLIICLHAMFQAGYMYGIIGWAGVPDFYRKIVGATVIENTDPPGSYRGLLGRGHLFE